MILKLLLQRRLPRADRTCPAVRRPSICALFSGDRVDVPRGPRRVDREASHSKSTFLRRITSVILSFETTTFETLYLLSDEIQGLRTGSRGSVLEISARSANPILIERNLCISIYLYLREPVISKLYTKENLFLKF